jgi:DNA repair protein RadC
MRPRILVSALDSFIGLSNFAGMLMQEIPETDRPREKLAKLGAAALTDAELLAIFLRTGRRGKSALGLASELIESKGSLRGLAKCDAAEIQKAVSGIGPAKASELCAAVELGCRLTLAGESNALLDSADAAYSFFAPIMHKMDREVLKIALLDTKLRLVREESAFTGTLNECVAHPREIFRPAIIHRAYAILIVHNHPSGDPAPSSADRTLTSRLREAADLLQINLIDHVIIGNPDGGRQPFFSFREAGFL